MEKYVGNPGRAVANLRFSLADCSSILADLYLTIVVLLQRSLVFTDCLMNFKFQDVLKRIPDRARGNQQQQPKKEKSCGKRLAFYPMRFEFEHDLINVQFPFLLGGRHAKEKSAGAEETRTSCLRCPPCCFFHRHVGSFGVMLKIWASCWFFLPSC